jgi:methionyl-tRNA formyltransferase
MPPLTIIFAGTPDFSVPSLQGLLDAGHRLAAVYTQPDRPAGRGRKLTASPVKRIALEAGVPVCQPATVRDPDAVEDLRALAPDLMVVVAYGLLLPQEVLDIPSLGCINVHASLLPRWRGAAPIQRAIMAGDTETGISIMRMEAGLDTGPVYLTRSQPIHPRETGGTLHDKLASLGAEALMKALPGIADGSLPARPQEDALATYAHKLSKEEAEINWNRSAVEIDRLIRAFDPWPVAQTAFSGGTLRLWAGEPLDTAGPDLPPGSVVGQSRAGIEVVTGQGVLRITRLQPPGKRPMTAADFLNARSLNGEVFG